MNASMTIRRWRPVVAALASCWIAGAVLPPHAQSTLPGIAFAAESDAAPETTSDSENAPEDVKKPAAEASEDAEANDEETPAKSDAGEDQSEEIFVPSEDISEDIDVPFPVDI